MKAAVFRGVGRPLQIEEVPIPQLQPGELLEVALRYELAVLAYECGELNEPKPAIVQRMVAQRIK